MNKIYIWTYDIVFCEPKTDEKPLETKLFLFAQNLCFRREQMQKLLSFEKYWKNWIIILILFNESLFLPLFLVLICQIQDLVPKEKNDIGLDLKCKPYHIKISYILTFNNEIRLMDVGLYESS